MNYIVPKEKSKWAMMYIEGKEYKFILQMQPGDNMPTKETIEPTLPPWVKFENVSFIFGTKYSIDKINKEK